jgi:alcohol dehydrogenase
MKALTYHGPRSIGWEHKHQPIIVEPTDAVVRIERTTICGTDLHILKGDVPSVEPGRTLGHEGVGTVLQIGQAVTNFAPGDRVIISCITSCARCEYCRRQMYSHCKRGGWQLGHRINGTQAEFVRIPYADTSLYKVPDNADLDALVTLSDILPTAFECGVLSGALKPGDTLAIVGAGPIGLATLLTARLYSPETTIVCDVDPWRLQLARELGATYVVDAREPKPAAQILRLTEGRGVDVAVEAVGVPETFDVCQEILAPGGHLANVGVHGRGANLRLEKLWDRNVTITTRLVDTAATPTLLRAVTSGRLRPRPLITHRFALSQTLDAYEVFANAAREHALKVILTADPLPAQEVS